MDIKSGWNELKDIQQVKRRVERLLMNAPEGSLWITENGNHYPQYYLWPGTDNATKKKIYLPKDNMKLIKELAQKDYLKKLEYELNTVESVLSTFLEQYEKHNLERVYDSLSTHKKPLVTPYPVLDEAFIEKWKKKILRNPARISYPVTTPYKTKNGEMVRSKSELIFADRLHDLSIPYLYEAPLLLKDGTTVFPDFTVLNCRTRQTIYIELFGMMDQPEYSNRAMEKIQEYHQNEIYQNVNFFFLMETEHFGIDISQMDHLIRHVLL